MEKCEVKNQKKKHDKSMTNLDHYSPYSSTYFLMTKQKQNKIMAATETKISTTAKRIRKHQQATQQQQKSN